MNAAELGKAAQTFQPITESLALGGPELSRPRRRYLSKAVRLLSEQAKELPATGKHRDTAIEAAAELDAMMAGFDALQTYAAMAKRDVVEESMRLRSLLLARRANISMGALVMALKAMASDDLDATP